MKRVDFFNSSIFYFNFETSKFHGLDNYQNNHIGYYYQNNRKGFLVRWLKPQSEIYDFFTFIIFFDI